MTITLKEKNNYGNILLYPVCDAAFLLMQFKGKVTFTTWDISILEKLGYTVNIQKLP